MIHDPSPEKIASQMQSREPLFMRAYRKTSPVLFYALLLTIVWRLADLLDELMAGVTKMSLGLYMLEGHDALIMQLLIIAMLMCAAYAISGRDARSETVRWKK